MPPLYNVFMRSKYTALKMASWTMKFNDLSYPQKGNDTSKTDVEDYVKSVERGDCNRSFKDGSDDQKVRYLPMVQTMPESLCLAALLRISKPPL